MWGVGWGRRGPPTGPWWGLARGRWSARVSFCVVSQCHRSTGRPRLVAGGPVPLHLLLWVTPPPPPELIWVTHIVPDPLAPGTGLVCAHFFRAGAPLHILHAAGQEHGGARRPGGRPPGRCCSRGAAAARPRLRGPGPGHLQVWLVSRWREGRPVTSNNASHGGRLQPRGVRRALAAAPGQLASSAFTHAAVTLSQCCRFFFCCNNSDHQSAEAAASLLPAPLLALPLHAAPWPCPAVTSRRRHCARGCCGSCAGQTGTEVCDSGSGALKSRSHPACPHVGQPLADWA